MADRLRSRKARIRSASSPGASSGGMYRSYATVQGVDEILPVDVYISGCPPRPEALIEAILEIQRKITRGERSASELSPPAHGVA